VEKGPVPRYHDSSIRNQGGGLKQRLRCPTGHHARQTPSRHRQRSFEGARGDDYLFRPDRPDTLRVAISDAEIAIYLPYRRLRTVIDARFTKSTHEFQSGSVVIAEQRQMQSATSGYAFGAAGNLAAGIRLFIEDHSFQADSGGGYCGRESRRPRANYRELICGAFGVAHPSILRAPSWRLMRIPSATGTRQAWRLGTPSISIKQSHVRLFMHSGARRP